MKNGRERVEKFVAAADAARLDRFLSERKKNLTRSRIHSLIREGMVSLNDGLARPSQRVHAGDRILLRVPPDREPDIVPQDMPLDVVYQDAEFVVIDKPAGLSVHPGPGHPDGTLVNALLARCPDIQGIGGVTRPGIVHRLDKDTSGLLVVAKTERAHQDLSEQIRSRQVFKGYLALSVGSPPHEEGLVDAPIARDPRHRKRMAVVLGGRESRTRYRLLGKYGAHSLLELVLETGRTHQIRVHLAYLGCPLYGDEVYGRRSAELGRHFLHASVLGFHHPSTGEPMTFRSELPSELRRVLSTPGTDTEG